MTTATAAVTYRRVKLRVANVPYLESYHGREAKLVGEVVDAVEMRTTDTVAFVDDRDGEASELVEAVTSAASAARVAMTPAAKNAALKYQAELRHHAQRRFLHGEVVGVRA